MPLIYCPECNNIVSDSAIHCPKCGFPIKGRVVIKDDMPNSNLQKNNDINKTTPKKNNGCGFILLIGFLLLVFGFLIRQCSNPDSKTQPISNVTITKEDSLKSKAKTDSINKQDKIDEEKFLKTKAGRIWKKHQEWSKEDCESLANHKIWIGMQYDMLVYERGKPNHINTSNYGSGQQYQACWDDYTPSCFYFDESRIITSYN